MTHVGGIDVTGLWKNTYKPKKILLKLFKKINQFLYFCIELAFF